MIRSFQPVREDPSDTPMLRLLEDVASRRLAGDALSDDEVVAAHPELMPDLRVKLQALRIAEVARSRASGSTWSLSVPSGDSADWSADGAGWTDALRDRYVLHEPVGRGAMGMVYRATQQATRREVAVKIMHQQPFCGPTDLSRFEREAHILAQLRHPNIVTVYDTGWVRGCFYLVMDYVAGRALHDHLRETGASLRDKLQLFARICEAVHEAHLRGIIHRDLKPSNIRIDAAGQPHLLDFGLAKMTAEAADPMSPDVFEHSMTLTGQFVGSLPWASPEQAEGDAHKIDVRTDVYALGVILYQMLTARFPYPVAGNIRDVIDRILTADPQRPSALAPEIDGEVETIVLKCLAKERGRRYQSAGDLAQDVRRYLTGEPIEAKRDSSWYMLRKVMRRHRWATGAGMAFASVVLVFGLTMSFLYREAKHEAHRANRTLAFLQETLFQASSHRLGSDAALVEVLDKAAGSVGTQFAGEPTIEADLRFTIGSAYETIWQKHKAIAQLRTALDLNRSQRGPEHPETLRCMVLLGMVMAEADQSGAVALQREALATRRRLYGAHHRLVADSTNELAYALWRASRPAQWAEAEEHYHRALGLYEEVIGQEHPEVARSLQGFAFMRLAQERFDEAEALFRRSLTMSRKLLGDEHQFTVECMEGLAVALQPQQRFDEARQLFDEVFELAPRLFGRSAMPRIHQRRAAFYLARGDLRQAEHELREAVAFQCRLADRHTVNQGVDTAALAASLREWPGPAADNVFREVVKQAAELGGSVRDAVGALMGLASMRRAQNDHRAAIALLEDALTLAKRVSRELDGSRGRIEWMLGDSLAVAGRLEEARAHLEAARRLLALMYGEASPKTHRVSTRLAGLAAPS